MPVHTDFPRSVVVALTVVIGISASATAEAQTFSKTANPSTGTAPVTVVYTYGFDNSQGKHQLFSVDTPGDDTCSPVTFTGGDANQNQLLDIGEIWTWTCTTLINATTTNRAQTSAKYSDCDGDTCTVTLMDFITARATVTIAALGVSIAGNTSACKDDVVTLTAVPTGGNPPYTFSWTTGATSQSINPNTSTPGTFNFGVTVTDTAGHTATANTAVTVSRLCLTEVPPKPIDPDFPLLTRIEWGCKWSFAGRCLSRTIVQICVGGQCYTNPTSPIPDICPRCDLLVGGGAGAVVGFVAAALLVRVRRRRS